MDLTKIDDLDAGRKVKSIDTADYAVVRVCPCGTKYYERMGKASKFVEVFDFWYNHRKICCKKWIKHRNYCEKEDDRL